MWGVHLVWPLRIRGCIRTCLKTLSYCEHGELARLNFSVAFQRDMECLWTEPLVLGLLEHRLKLSELECLPGMLRETSRHALYRPH